MTWLHLLAFLVLVLPLSLGRAEATQQVTERPFAATDCQQGADLSDTQLQLTLQPETGHLSGSYTALLHNHSAQALAAPCFALNPGMELQTLELSTLEKVSREPRQGNQPLLYRTQLKHPLAAGASQRIHLRYAGQIQAAPKFGASSPKMCCLRHKAFFIRALYAAPSVSVPCP